MGLFWFLVITFISVFSGAAFGQIMATHWDRIKRREEEAAQLVRAKESIATELRNVLDDAEVYLAIFTQPHPGTFLTLRPFMNAMNATIGSGTFALIEPALQEQISYVYGLISQSLDQMRRIRDFDAGFSLTLPGHVKDPILEEMENQLVAVVRELPGRLPELIQRLTESTSQTIEEANKNSDPSG